MAAQPTVAELLAQYDDRVLSGDGALAFARENGFDYFDPITAHRKLEYEQKLNLSDRKGTVGCVALDGDGTIAALQVLAAMQQKQQSLNELLDGITIYPQVLINVKTNANYQWQADQKLNAMVSKVEESLIGKGRVLIRPSGTEPVLRIMVEAGGCAGYKYMMGLVNDAEPDDTVIERDEAVVKRVDELWASLGID